MDIVDRPPHRPELCSHSSRVLSYKSKKTTPKALRWPHSDSFPLSPAILASAGYFHDPVESEPDRTTCWMCGESTKDWVATDDPWSVHLEWASNCPFARLAILDRQRDTQIPAWPDVFNQPWGPTADWFPRGQVMIEARLATFCGQTGQWRHESVEGLPTRIELARAGFHFAPNSFKKGRKLEVDDTTSCCYCRRTVSEWEAGDDPVSIHLKKGPCIFFSATPPVEVKSKNKPESTRKVSVTISKKASGKKAASTTQDDDPIEEPVGAPALTQSRGASKKVPPASSGSGKSSRPTRRGVASATASPTREQSPAGYRDPSPAPAPTRQKLPRATHKAPSSHVLSSPDPIEFSSKPPVSMPQTTRLSRSTSRAPSTISNSRIQNNNTSAQVSRTRARGTSQTSVPTDLQASVIKPSNSANFVSDVDEVNTDASTTKPKTRKTRAEKLVASTSAPAELSQPITSRSQTSSDLHHRDPQPSLPEDSAPPPSPVSAPKPATKPPKTRKAAPTKRQKSATPNPQQQNSEPAPIPLLSLDQPSQTDPQTSGPSHQQIQPNHVIDYDPKAPQLYSGILPIATKSTRPPTQTEKNSTQITSPNHIPTEVDDLLDEYFNSKVAEPLPEGWLTNPYNPSKPFPPLNEIEAKMKLDEYFSYRAEQEEKSFLTWVEERKMRPWLKKVEEGRQLIEELIRNNEINQNNHNEALQNKKEKKKKVKKDH